MGGEHTVRRPSARVAPVSPAWQSVDMHGITSLKRDQAESYCGQKFACTHVCWIQTCHMHRPSQAVPGTQFGCEQDQSRLFCCHRD